MFFDNQYPSAFTNFVYYPFGMGMPGRKYFANNGYRYGFNGKENDNDVKGEGNQQDYGMRIYDARLGKFNSNDPLDKQYPYYSPYQFSGNSPIAAVDIDGLEPKGYAYVSNNPNNYSFKRYDNVGNETRTIEGVGKVNGTMYRVQDALGDDYWTLERTSIEYYSDPITGLTQSAVKKESFYFTKPPSSSQEAYKEGKWLPYETTSQQQTRAGNEAANLIGTFWFGVAAVAAAAPALVEGVSILTPLATNVTTNITANAATLYGTYAATAANFTNTYLIPLLDPSGQAGQMSPASFRANAVEHIFDASQKLENTPASKQLLLNISNDVKNYLGTDKHGNDWFAKIIDGGKQVWTQVRNGEIFNGGLNEQAVNFIENEGLKINPNIRN